METKIKGQRTVAGPPEIQQPATASSTPTDFRQEEDSKGAGLFVKRPKSRPERHILPFYPAAWWGGGMGISKESRETVPAALAERGVGSDFWIGMMDRLEKEVQSTSPSICAQVAYWSTLLCVPLMCHQITRYQQNLHRWLDDLNDELVPKGMYAKIQTSEVHSKDYHESLSWVAIAMTPAEVQLLQAEPVVYAPGCCTPVMYPSSCQYVLCFCGERRYV